MEAITTTITKKKVEEWAEAFLLSRRTANCTSDTLRTY